jgi:hypothetical protein
MLLTFRGRRTGRVYTTPVGYVQLDDTVLFGVRLGPDGQPDAEDVARARREGHVVVRVPLA